MLRQCSGTNRIRICRKGSFTTTDATLICLTSLFYKFSVPAPQNCHVESVLLPDAPRLFTWQMVFTTPSHLKLHFPMMNDYSRHGSRMSTIDCKACFLCLGCSYKLTLDHGDLVSNPDMDYCEARPKPFVARVQLPHRCKRF